MPTQNREAQPLRDYASEESAFRPKDTQGKSNAAQMNFGTAEDHHGIWVMVEGDSVHGKRRDPDSVAGIGELHDLVGDNGSVVEGVEIEGGDIGT